MESRGGHVVDEQRDHAATVREGDADANFEDTEVALEGVQVWVGLEAGMPAPDVRRRSGGCPWERGLVRAARLAIGRDADAISQPLATRRDRDVESVSAL